MNLPKVDELDVSGKRVLVRGDLDLGEDIGEGDVLKLKTQTDTLNYLIENKAKIILIGHRGRPEGKVDGKYSLAPVVDKLKELLNRDIDHVHDLTGQEAHDRVSNLSEGDVAVLMNLRFDPREESGDEGFANILASYAQFYVNEAFSSHRPHTSVVGIPKIMKSRGNGNCAFGFHFIKEIENLSKVRENPERPVTMVIGGAKKDKLNYVGDFLQFADNILIGGRLPFYMTDEEKDAVDDKIFVSNLNPDNEDITIRSIEKMEAVLSDSGTTHFAGPMGKYEEIGQKLGTERVLKATVDSAAYKTAGGGDSQQAIYEFGLQDKFDWISVGGGASLRFLATGTLPAIKVLKS